MLKREELMELGLSEEQADTIIADQKDYVPRTRLKEETDAAAALKGQLDTLNKDIETLRAQAGNGSDLEQQIKDMQEKYDKDTKALQEQADRQRLDAALDVELMKSKCRDLIGAKAHLKIEDLKLKDDGTIEGLEIDKLIEKLPHNFEIEKSSEEGVTNDHGNTSNQSKVGEDQIGDIYSAVEDFYKT